MTECQHLPEPGGDGKRGHGLPQFRDPRLPQLLLKFGQLQVLGRSFDGAWKEEEIQRLIKLQPEACVEVVLAICIEGNSWPHAEKVATS